MAGDAGYGTAPDHAAPWVSAPGATDPGVLVGPDTLDIPSPTTSGAGCAPLAAPKSGGLTTPQPLPEASAAAAHGQPATRQE